VSIMEYIYLVVGCGIALFIFEIFFRIWVEKKNIFINCAARGNWNKTYMEAHPFLSFAYKKNTHIDNQKRIPYPLNPGKYFSHAAPVKINNCGHIGDDFSLRKEKGNIRVLCLGDSVTANVISSDRIINHSYPTKLNKLLNAHGGKERYEVFNCGVTGWTCQEIYINFCLNLIQLNPDIVIFYAGFNDVQFHLHKMYTSDLRYVRKGLDGVLDLIKVGYWVPSLPFFKLYEYMRNLYFPRGNVRDDILKMINPSHSMLDYSSGYETLRKETAIFEHLVAMSEHYKFRLIFSTYAFYNWNRDSEYQSKIAEGMEIQNDNIRKVASTHKVELVDFDKSVNKDSTYFLDCVHLTPKGMHKLSHHLREEICNDD